MKKHRKAPTTREIWDFLVDLKKVTEAGFTRVASEMAGLRTELGGDMARLETSLRSDIARLETRLSSVQARVARIEGWNLDRRFDVLEARVARLEPA